MFAGVGRVGSRKYVILCNDISKGQKIAYQQINPGEGPKKKTTKVRTYVRTGSTLVA